MLILELIIPIIFEHVIQSFLDIYLFDIHFWNHNISIEYRCYDVT